MAIRYRQNVTYTVGVSVSDSDLVRREFAEVSVDGESPGMRGIPGVSLSVHHQGQSRCLHLETTSGRITTRDYGHSETTAVSQ